MNAVITLITSLIETILPFISGYLFKSNRDKAKEIHDAEQAKRIDAHIDKLTDANVRELLRNKDK